MAKIGRPMGQRKYKAKAFKDKCEAYFRSISYTVPALRKEIVTNDEGFPELDDFGHAIFKYVPIVTEDGEEVKEVFWTEPPSVQGLCLFLGIDSSTFSRYLRPTEDSEESKKLAQTAAFAKARVEAYLIKKLEDKGAANGVKFNLQHNFGWAEKKEIELGAGAQAAAASAGLTMEERLAILREIGAEVPE